MANSNQQYKARGLVTVGAKPISPSLQFNFVERQLIRLSKSRHYTCQAIVRNLSNRRPPRRPLPDVSGSFDIVVSTYNEELNRLSDVVFTSENRIAPDTWTTCETIHMNKTVEPAVTHLVIESVDGSNLVWEGLNTSELWGGLDMEITIL